MSPSKTDRRPSTLRRISHSFQNKIRVKVKGLHFTGYRLIAALALLVLTTLFLVGCPQSQKSTDDLLLDLKSSDIDTRVGAAFILGDREPEVIPSLILALQKEKEGKILAHLVIKKPWNGPGKKRCSTRDLILTKRVSTGR